MNAGMKFAAVILWAVSALQIIQLIVVWAQSGYMHSMEQPTDAFIYLVVGKLAWDHKEKI